MKIKYTLTLILVLVCVANCTAPTPRIVEEMARATRPSDDSLRLAAITPVPHSVPANTLVHVRATSYHLQNSSNAMAKATGSKTPGGDGGATIQSQRKLLNSKGGF